jgi:hypothetical protein
MCEAIGLLKWLKRDLGAKNGILLEVLAKVSTSLYWAKVLAPGLLNH